MKPDSIENPNPQFRNLICEENHMKPYVNPKNQRRKNITTRRFINPTRRERIANCRDKLFFSPLHYK